jgi:hypothetical protein
MKDYSVRVGVESREEPASTWSELFSMRYEICDDDGLVIDLGEEPWPDHVQCPDCKRSEIMWAEAGSVPGHRICPTCGSHWNMYPKKGEWFLRRARFYS